MTIRRVDDNDHGAELIGQPIPESAETEPRLTEGFVWHQIPGVMGRVPITIEAVRALQAIKTLTKARETGK